MNKSTLIWIFFVVLLGTLVFADTQQTGIATFNVIFTGAAVDITKTDSPDPVLSGGTLTYFLLVNVTGNASNVTVVETYPGNIVFNSSMPAPSSGNDTWDLGNLTNTTFQINITVNVSPFFVGFLVNNVTVFFNQPNGSLESSNDTEVTTVISPTPPTSGGQGGGSNPAGGCGVPTTVQRRVGGDLVTFYTCCTNADCYRVWRLNDAVCASRPEVLAAKVCVPAAHLQMPVLARGVCPVERMCAQQCCDFGEVCYSGRCVIPRSPEVLVPAEPQGDGFIILGVQELSFLWLLLLIILAILLLVILAILASIYSKDAKKKKRKK